MGIGLFLSSYKMFHTKETLLEELMVFVNYYFNDKTMKKAKDTELFENLSRNFIQLLEKWTDMYPGDFSSSSFRKRFIVMLQLLPQHIQTNTLKLKMIKGAKSNPKNNSPLIDQLTLGLISHTSPQDIANALTAKEALLFKKIQPEEFYQCSRMKPEKYQLSPNLLALSDSFENLTQWISQCILIDGTKARAKRIQKFISIAQRLLRQNNFQTMMAVISGLEVIHISRLKKSWELVSQQSKQIFDEMKSLMDSKNNFSHCRKALDSVLQNSETFAIPYFPVILRDLTYIYEGISSDCTMDNIELIGKQLSTILTLQQRNIPSDEFTVKDSLLHYFATIDPQSNEEELYQRSLQLEPIKSKTSLKISNNPSSRIVSNSRVEIRRAKTVSLSTKYPK